MSNVSLAQSDLIKATKRLAILPVLFDSAAYSDVVGEAREIVELALKAMLRQVGAEPPKWHDVSSIVAEFAQRFRADIQADIPPAVRFGWAAPRAGVVVLRRRRLHSHRAVQCGRWSAGHGRCALRGGCGRADDRSARGMTNDASAVFDRSTDEMSNQHSFRALVLEQEGEELRAEVRPCHEEDLPEGDVLVTVSWSGLNYKDALALTNRGRIIRRFPMVPGIDLVGRVVASSAPDVRVGDAVILTGYGTGEDHWGGYSQRNRVRAEWLVPLPAGLTERRAMAIGTAGFTAMLAVMALEEHGVHPDSGDVVVTGAAGGVGSFAIALLGHRGHRVVASTGRPELAGDLKRLGASEVIDRGTLAEPSERPLLSERWAGAVDTVGGATLANLLAGTRRHGAVAACGLVSGAALTTTVYPFILRGVSLLGIDSNYCPMDRRRHAWERLARELGAEEIDEIVSGVVGLDGLVEAAQAVMAGRVHGRLIVDVNAPGAHS